MSMVNLPRTTDDRWDTGNEAGDEDEVDMTEYPIVTESSQPATEPEQEQKQPKYTNVIDWVNGFFLPVIRRRISDNDGGLSWDARWWAYPEVVARLTALHQAWEEARASDSMSAMTSG